MKNGGIFATVFSALWGDFWVFSAFRDSKQTPRKSILPFQTVFWKFVSRRIFDFNSGQHPIYRNMRPDCPFYHLHNARICSASSWAKWNEVEPVGRHKVSGSHIDRLSRTPHPPQAVPLPPLGKAYSGSPRPSAPTMYRKPQRKSLHAKPLTLCYPCDRFPRISHPQKENAPKRGIISKILYFRF